MAPAFSLNRKSALSPDRSLTVGVLLGGTSSEKKISRKSGKAVVTALKASGVRVCVLDPAQPARFRSRLSQIDLAFIALHGRGGEDGAMQRKLERCKIPYTGSGPAASRNAFDKIRAKQLFKRSGVPTPPFCIIHKRNWARTLQRFGVPAFAKPVADGSSMGVFAVENLGRSAVKIRAGLARYGRLLVEKKIAGREFTVGILGQKPLPVIELIPEREFFDYKAKYTPGMTRYDVPARIPRRFARQLQRIALRAHKCLGLRDFSRVDMMTDSGGKIFVLEANSIPGLTSMSLLPKAARSAGIPFEKLCLQLVRMAAKRGKNA